MKSGTVAVVTGAASGIGRAIAQAAVDRGAGSLVLLDVDEGGMKETARLLGTADAHAIRLDVTDAVAVEAAFAQIAERHSAIDFLFNSAGIQAGLPAWPDVSAARIRAVLEVNVLGLMFATRFAIPLMRERGGSILNVASISGLHPYLNGSVYGPSKAAVILFTQCNKELAQRCGIRVNAICPAMVDTPFLRKTGEADGEIAPHLQAVLDAGQVLSAEQVAHAAICLACDESKFGEYEVLMPSQGGSDRK